MRWHTADPLEILWTVLGGLGLLAVLLLVPTLIGDVRATLRVRDKDGLIMASANLLIVGDSLFKIGMLLALGLYSLGQPPSSGNVSTGGLWLRGGAVLLEVLIVAPPWILLGARRWIERRNR